MKTNKDKIASQITLMGGLTNKADEVGVLTDEKTFVYQVVDPSAQGQVANTIRPISINFTKEDVVIEGSRTSQYTLTAYWDDIWKEIAVISTVSNKAEQVYLDLKAELEDIQALVKAEKYDDARTATQKFLTNLKIANDSLKMTAEAGIYESEITGIGSLSYDINNGHMTIKLGDSYVNHLVAGLEKSDGFTFSRIATVHTVDHTKGNSDTFEIWFEQPFNLKDDSKMGHIRIARNEVVLHTVKGTFEQFSKIADKLSFSLNKLGFTKDQRTGQLVEKQAGGGIVQNIFFDSTKDMDAFFQKQHAQPQEEKKETPKGLQPGEMKEAPQKVEKVVPTERTLEEKEKVEKALESKVEDKPTEVKETAKTDTNVSKTSADDVQEAVVSDDKIHGGKADGKSVEDIANMWLGKEPFVGQTIETVVTEIQKQITIGQEIEMEHTDNKQLAFEIAKDHLCELPNYYTKLQEAEAEWKKELGLSQDNPKSTHTTTTTEASKKNAKGSFTLTRDEARKLWGSGDPITVDGKEYTVHKMSYGDYFLEPGNDTMRSETDGFASGTLWLERIDGNPDLLTISASKKASSNESGSLDVEYNGDEVEIWYEVTTRDKSGRNDTYSFRFASRKLNDDEDAQNWLDENEQKLIDLAEADIKATASKKVAKDSREFVLYMYDDSSPTNPQGYFLRYDDPEDEVAVQTGLNEILDGLYTDIPEADSISLYISAISNAGGAEFRVDYNTDDTTDALIDKIDGWLLTNTQIHLIARNAKKKEASSKVATEALSPGDEVVRKNVSEDIAKKYNLLDGVIKAVYPEKNMAAVDWKGGLFTFVAMDSLAKVAGKKVATVNLESITEEQVSEAFSQEGLQVDKCDTEVGTSRLYVTFSSKSMTNDFSDVVYKSLKSIKNKLKAQSYQVVSENPWMVHFTFDDVEKVAVTTKKRTLKRIAISVQKGEAYVKRYMEPFEYEDDSKLKEILKSYVAGTIDESKMMDQVKERITELFDTLDIPVDVKDADWDKAEIDFSDIDKIIEYMKEDTKEASSKIVAIDIPEMPMVVQGLQLLGRWSYKERIISLFRHGSPVGSEHIDIVIGSSYKGTEKLTIDTALDFAMGLIDRADHYNNAEDDSESNSKAKDLTQLIKISKEANKKEAKQRRMSEEKAYAEFTRKRKTDTTFAKQYKADEALKYFEDEDIVVTFPKEAASATKCSVCTTKMVESDTPARTRFVWLECPSCGNMVKTDKLRKQVGYLQEGGKFEQTNFNKNVRYASVIKKAETLYIDYAGGRFESWYYSKDGGSDTVKGPSGELSSIKNFAKKYDMKVVMTDEAKQFAKKAGYSTQNIDPNTAWTLAKNWEAVSASDQKYLTSNDWRKSIRKKISAHEVSAEINTDTKKTIWLRFKGNEWVELEKPNNLKTAPSTEVWVAISKIDPNDIIEEFTTEKAASEWAELNTSDRTDFLIEKRIKDEDGNYKPIK